MSEDVQPGKATTPEEEDRNATRYSGPSPQTPGPPAPAGPDTPGEQDRGPGLLPVPGQLGRYRILSLLGQGGMGSVYLAHDTSLDRRVALKVPRPEVAADPRSLERFKREARAAAQLRHPHICPVYDVGAEAGLHYLTMAFIEGRPLSALVPGLRGQPGRAAGLVRKLALALD